MSEKESEPNSEPFAETLMAVFLETWAPGAQTPGQGYEMKTTREIAEEMEDMMQVDFWKINVFMQQNHFVPGLANGRYFWHLYPRKE